MRWWTRKKDIKEALDAALDVIDSMDLHCNPQPGDREITEPQTKRLNSALSALGIKER